MVAGGEASSCACARVWEDTGWEECVCWKAVWACSVICKGEGHMMRTILCVCGLWAVGALAGGLHPPPPNPLKDGHTQMHTDVDARIHTATPTSRKGVERRVNLTPPHTRGAHGLTHPLIHRHTVSPLANGSNGTSFSLATEGRCAKSPLPPPSRGPLPSTARLTAPTNPAAPEPGLPTASPAASPTDPATASLPGVIL